MIPYCADITKNKIICNILQFHIHWYGKGYKSNRSEEIVYNKYGEVFLKLYEKVDWLNKIVL